MNQLKTILSLIGIAAASFFALSIFPPFAFSKKVSQAPESLQEQGHPKAVMIIKKS